MVGARRRRPKFFGQRAQRRQEAGVSRGQRGAFAARSEEGSFLAPHPPRVGGDGFTNQSAQPFALAHLVRQRDRLARECGFERAMQIGLRIDIHELRALEQRIKDGRDLRAP